MPRLKKGETARWVACVAWVEDLQRLYGDNYYGMLIAFLAGLNLEIAISPVHDKDWYTYEDVRRWVKRRMDPDSGDFIDVSLEECERRAPKVGDLKKAHIHILFRLEGRRNAKWLSELMGDFVTIPETKWERVDSLSRYTCYLVHLYNDDKYKYPITSVVPLAGFDLSPLIDMTDNQKEEVYDYVNQVIKDLGYKYYYQLNNWATDSDNPRVKSIVRGNHSYFNTIFRSLREHKFDEAQARKAREEVSKAG